MEYCYYLVGAWSLVTAWDVNANLCSEAPQLMMLLAEKRTWSNWIKLVNNSFKCPPRDILIQQQLRGIHLQQEVTSMAMQLHGFFFGLLELPWDILSSWRWQLQSATCALRQPNSVMGWTNVQKIKLTTAMQRTYPVVCIPVQWYVLEITNALSVTNTHHQDV